MKPHMHPWILFSALIPLMAAVSGCKTVARENIITHINTGIGLTLAENPSTQLYELKAGFIRTQTYSIPTGKRVEGCDSSNGADVTPQLVSGIRADSGIQQLFLGMDIAENFAVGSEAVNSPAAIAMYIAQATDTGRAQGCGPSGERRFLPTG